MAPGSNDWYRRLVERSPDAIFVCEDDRIVFVNPAAMALFGASTPEQMLGRTVWAIFHPGSQSLVREGLARVLAGVAPLAEERLVSHDGSVVDVELTSTLLEGDAARTIQLIVRDITQRKRAESALRESEERLSLAFAGAQEGVWDWNLETGAVVYSTQWKQMLGYGDQELEPHISAWERLLHPDDREYAQQVHESVTRGEPTYTGEFRLRHKDGHYVYVLSRGLPIRREPDGPVVRIVGTHFDLSERKRAEAALRESEERLSLAFAGAQEGVWDWNLETGAVVYSPRWKEMLGYAEDEIEPHVNAWERLLHPDDWPRARLVNESVARGEPTYMGEFRLRHKDGHYVHVLSRGIPVRREPGGPAVRIVGTHFDLTERRQADAERARTELLARLVFVQEDERRRIARDMHDQFGEQLTALGRGISTLKDSCRDRTDLHGQVETIEAVAQQIDRDVDQLIWQLRPTALDDLGVRAALANYVQDWSRRVNIPAELHSSGLLDDRLPSETETTLYRIAQEALTNVAKHARARNVEVILERRADHVILIVEDDGVGFDPGANITRPGFGLLGMKERAAMVGATLEIESASGKGTTILVRMAASASAGAEAASGKPQGEDA